MSLAAGHGVEDTILPLACSTFIEQKSEETFTKLRRHVLIIKDS